MINQFNTVSNAVWNSARQIASIRANAKHSGACGSSRVYSASLRAINGYG